MDNIPVCVIPTQCNIHQFLKTDKKGIYKAVIMQSKNSETILSIVNRRKWIKNTQE